MICHTDLSEEKCARLTFIPLAEKREIIKSHNVDFLHFSPPSIFIAFLSTHLRLSIARRNILMFSASSRRRVYQHSIQIPRPKKSRWIECNGASTPKHSSVNCPTNTHYAHFFLLLLHPKHLNFMILLH